MRYMHCTSIYILSTRDIAHLIGVHTISINHQISLMLYCYLSSLIKGIKQAVIVGLNFAKQPVIVGFNFNTSTVVYFYFCKCSN